MSDYVRWRESYTNSNNSDGKKIENVQTQEKDSPSTFHNILYYTTWWPDHKDPASWDLGEGAGMFQNCAHKNCYLTANKKFLPQLHQYSALLFHTWKLFSRDVHLPIERSPLQKYIMFSIEPFSHCAYLNPWEEKVLTNFFNTTFSFRKDSDIYVPYGRILEQDNSSNLQVSQLQEEYLHSSLYSELKLKLSQKVDTALWLASHCWTDSGREGYVKELNEHLNISVIGGCAKDVLGKESATNDDLSQYYFYLAFENSKCKDYVTEKLFRGMKEFVVPIVLGGADYTSIAPQSSYIDVRDFESPLELANHLRFLIDNPAEYLKYFWWKPYYRVIDEVNPLTPHDLPSSFPCALCAYLNTAGVSQVTNLTKVWRVDSECEEKSTYHCNRDKEKWYPGREEYRKKLEEMDKTYIVDLQQTIN
eukprot:GFUD01130498.1.p1 GENE.GFUD01130498.1~~GFUD01130498.1.p1  ORF type:complete len:419 (+),score=81.45 GFUD01130498.1:117-1373(+)